MLGWPCKLDRDVRSTIPLLVVFAIDYIQARFVPGVGGLMCCLLKGEAKESGR